MKTHDLRDVAHLRRTLQLSQEMRSPQSALSHPALRPLGLQRPRVPPVSVLAIPMQSSFEPRQFRLPLFGIAAAIATWASAATAVSSSELYTTAAYTYGRFETRTRFAAGDGVISSFFLWKDGSEMSDVFWNELDFEKLRANCEVETNALYGMPEMSHNAVFEPATPVDLCGEYHTYGYEWTPDYIAWFVDGAEIRRETGATAAAFRDNATQGMQIHFNIWPGDASFGGNFSPAILPVHQFINWVQYSSYTQDAFELEWREDFNGGLPAGWSTGSWASPKNLSTHVAGNVTFRDGYAILSLTEDNATGFTGAVPVDSNENSETTDGSESNGTSAESSAPTSPTSDSDVSDTVTESLPTEPPATTTTTATTSAPPTSTEPPTTTTTPSTNPSTTAPSTNPSTTAPNTPVVSPVPSGSATTSNTSSTPPSTDTNATASTVPPATTADPNTDAGSSGCACRIERGERTKPWGWLLSLFTLAALLRRRSR